MKRAQAPVQADRVPQPGRIRAVFLAVAVHAAFFALIVFGVRWQSSPTVPLQAELWSKLPPVAKAAPPEPPKPEPPKPEPPPPKPPEEVKPEPAKPDPAIAMKLEREKREKEKREKLEKQKQEETRKKREEEAKKKREEEKRRKEEEIARREAEKAREVAAVARATEIDMWKRRIHDKIRSRANVPDTVTGNPEVTVLIHILPGGEVLDVQITQRSGNPTYDAAIERAIRSAQPLPVPAPDSELFPSFRDLRLKIRHER